MGIEIERRFLTCDASWRAESVAQQHITQGYIVNESDKTVRIRITDQSAWLTVKRGIDVLNRAEFEYEIPRLDGQQMIDSFCQNQTIQKVRHRIPAGDLTWEIDVFEGANVGLVIAEIELPTAETQFGMPKWLGQEITADIRYLNSRLLKSPWSTWGRIQ